MSASRKISNLRTGEFFHSPYFHLVFIEKLRPFFVRPPWENVQQIHSQSLSSSRERVKTRPDLKLKNFTPYLNTSFIDRERKSLAASLSIFDSHHLLKLFFHDFSCITCYAFSLFRYSMFRVFWCSLESPMLGRHATVLKEMYNH